MGRLGFNLVRQKEATKSTNVESGNGGVPDQQNERNESVEISELILTIEERNRTIKNLRLLSGTLTAVILCLCAYILLAQSTFFCNHNAVASSINRVEESYYNKMEALQGQYDAVMNTINEERTKNCTQRDTAEKDKLRSELLAQQLMRSQEISEARDKYDTLEAKFEGLKKNCTKKEADLQEELKNLQAEKKTIEEERTELVKKVEENNRKLLERSSQRQARTTTTTPAPHGLFSVRRFNDMVKDIESVGRLIGNVLSDAI